MRCTYMVQEGGPWAREHQCKNTAKGKLESGKPGCQIHINKEQRHKIQEDQEMSRYVEYREKVDKLNKLIQEEFGYGFVCIAKPDAKYVHIALTEREVRTIIQRLTPTLVDRTAMRR